MLIGYIQGEDEFSPKLITIPTNYHFTTDYRFSIAVSPKRRAEVLLTDIKHTTEKVITDLLNPFDIPCQFQLLSYDEDRFIYVISSKVDRTVFMQLTINRDLTMSLVDNSINPNLKFYEELSAAITLHNQSIKDKKSCYSV